MQLKWLGVGAALLLGGCASVEMAKYSVTSFPEVTLSATAEKPANIKLVAKDKSLQPVIDMLNSEFAKRKDFKVVQEGADYWFVLGGTQAYAKGAPHRKLVKTTQDNGSGGSEVVAEQAVNLASASKSVSIAVYETKTLAPVHYFEIPLYDGDNGASAVKPEGDYAVGFTKDVVERVLDVFVQQQKDVETPMPKEADSALRELFAKRDYKGFAAKFKSLAIDLNKLCKALKDVEEGKADDAAKALVKTADAQFGNLYLNLLVKEAQTMDPKELQKIYDAQLVILENTEANGLVESCPVALARLEYKLANVGSDED